MVTLSAVVFWVCCGSVALILTFMAAIISMQKLLIREQQQMCRATNNVVEADKDLIRALERQVEVEKESTKILAADNGRLAGELKVLKQAALKTLRTAPITTKMDDTEPIKAKPAPPTKAQVDAAKRGLGEIVRDLRA